MDQDKIDWTVYKTVLDFLHGGKFIPISVRIISRAYMGFLKIALDNLTKSPSAKTGDPH